MSQRVQFTPVQIWLVPFWLDPMQLDGISSNIKYNWQHVTDRSNCYNSHGMIQSDMLYSVYTSFHLFNHPFFVNEGDNVLWEFQMRNWPSFHMEFGTWMTTALNRVMNTIFYRHRFYRFHFYSFQHACTDLIAYCLSHPDPSARQCIPRNFSMDNYFIWT